MNSLRTDPIRHIRPIFPGLGRGLDLLLPSFLLSREEKKVPFIRGMRQRERFCPFLSPFLSLMKEKEAKENQGVRDASPIYRVPAGAVRDADPIRHIRPIFPGLGRGLDLLLPSFLLSREEKKVPFIRGMRQRERFCLLLSPFLSSRKEKEAKENQGVRDASQICRVPAGAVSTLRPLTVLCDPLYKCAGRLWVLVGWGRSVMGRVWGLNDLHIIY